MILETKQLLSVKEIEQIILSVVLDCDEKTQKYYQHFIKKISCEFLFKTVIEEFIQYLEELYEPEIAVLKTKYLTEENKIGFELYLETVFEKNNEQLEGLLTTEKIIAANIVEFLKDLNLKTLFESWSKGINAKFEEGMARYLELKQLKNEKPSTEEYVWFVLVTIFSFEAVELERHLRSLRTS